jgi:hypothetical protein
MRTLTNEQLRAQYAIATMIDTDDSGSDLMGIGMTVKVAVHLAEDCGLSLSWVMALCVEKFGKNTVRRSLLTLREAYERYARALPLFPPNVLRCLTDPTPNL